MASLENLKIKKISLKGSH